MVAKIKTQNEIINRVNQMLNDIKSANRAFDKKSEKLVSFIEKDAKNLEKEIKAGAKDLQKTEKEIIKETDGALLGFISFLDEKEG